MKLKRELPDWIDAWVEFMSNSEAPTIYNRWVAVSMIAAVLERKVFLKWDKLIYPNFYIILVGPPAGGKGSAMTCARDILDECNIQLAADATTKEKLAIRLAESKTDFEIMGDIELYKQSAITIFSDEFTVFLGYGNQEIMPWLCDWYDCKKKWAYETKNMGDSGVTNLWLNILGGTTPELLQDVLPRESFGSGLNSRILYVYAPGRERLIVFPFAKPNQDKEIKLLSEELQQIGLLKGEFIPDETYLEVWKKWYPAQRNFTMNNDSRMAGYVGRRPTHVHKLSMVLNASRDGNLLLTSDDLERAIAFLNDMEGRMHKAFAGIGMSKSAPLTHSILSFIRMRGEVLKSELHNQFIFDANEEEMRVALATMEITKMISIIHIKEEKDFLIRYLPSDTSDEPL